MLVWNGQETFIKHMRILEITTQNVKVLYKPSEERLAAGDFLDFEEGSLINTAQVYRISSTGDPNEYNQAELTFVLTQKFDKVSSWQGEVVSADAKISKTPLEKIEKYINSGDENDIFAVGYMQGSQNIPLKLSYKNFMVPAFVGYERQADNKAFLDEISHQFKNSGKNLLIIDYNGNLETEGASKLVAGYQMKLPLSAEMLENLSGRMTDGISAESRAVIEEVLVDLAQYAKDSASGFISISHLIKVIDDIYKKSKISQLIMLKNRLRTYQKQNIFADSADEIVTAQEIINVNNILILDLSNIPADWQNEFAYQFMQKKNGMRNDFYMYLPVNSQNIDNKLINYLMFKSVKDGIKPIISADYKHVAMDTILDFSANSFLFQTTHALKKREYLSDILTSLPPDYCLICGKLTSSLILPIYLGGHIDEFDNKVIEEKNKENNETLDVIQNSIDTTELEEEKSPEIKIDMDAINTAIDINETAETTPVTEETKEEIALPEENILSDEIENLSEGEADIIPLPEEDISEPDIEENNITLDEISNDDLIELEEEQSETKADDIAFLDDIEDENKTFTQTDEDELLDLLSDEDEPAQDIEDISVDDLDFDMQETDTPKEEASTKNNLPVYEADYDKGSKTSSIDLKEGDLVKHNKYGLGTVKKLMNHGSKKMYSINFEDFGRRLLDPEISQLEKIQ